VQRIIAVSETRWNDAGLKLVLSRILPPSFSQASAALQRFDALKVIHRGNKDAWGIEWWKLICVAPVLRFLFIPNALAFLRLNCLYSAVCIYRRT